MTRLTLTDVLFAFALFVGLVFLPALLVNAALFVWHLPVVGCPLCLVALVAFCWAVGRWIWRTS